MPSRRLAICVLVVGLFSAGGVLATGVHTTPVVVGPQVVDGEVVADRAAVPRRGFLVVHRDDDGSPGAPIGSAKLSPGTNEDVGIGLDESLPNGESTVLWVVIHRDDGDGSFEPGTDSPVTQHGQVAGVSFPARSGDRPVHVLTVDGRSQPTSGTVRVNQVALAEDGHVVIRRPKRGGLGPVVGHASLGEGVHRNVSVELSGAAFPEGRSYVQLVAVAYRDDGDGSFDPEADRPITVRERPVASQFFAERTGPIPTATPTRTPTVTTTDSPEETTTDGPGETTGGPKATTADGTTSDPGETVTGGSSPTATTGGPGDTTAGSPAGTDGPTSTTRVGERTTVRQPSTVGPTRTPTPVTMRETVDGGSGPGFGVGAAVVAVLVSVALAAARFDDRS